jgi:23S rRNA (adenine2030-N6)-methyltransferase
LHYRHSFHAGNFADVFKHAVLWGLLQAMSRKDKPWRYLETHSGAGAYDLAGEGATRTGEWREGIGLLYAMTDAPEPLASLLDFVRRFNGGGALRHYPGSPLMALACAREIDRVVLCERVTEIVEELKAHVSGEKLAIVHRRDGYEAHALLPPAEKRGLVLIDPPFERPDEFEAVGDLLEKMLARFASGVYAAWYPLKNRHAAGRLERRAAKAAGKPVLRLELSTGARGEGQMRACAVLVVNPPFGFDESLAASGEWLRRELAQGRHAAFTSTRIES